MHEHLREPGPPQSVNTPVPAQFNLAPMFESLRRVRAKRRRRVPGNTPRGGNQPPANAAPPTGQQGPAPTANAAAQSPGGVAPTMVVPTLIPTPVVVSPPSFSGFAAPAPANQNANTTGTAPAPEYGRSSSGARCSRKRTTNRNRIGAGRRADQRDESQPGATRRPAMQARKSACLMCPAPPGR